MHRWTLERRRPRLVSVPPTSGPCIRCGQTTVCWRTDDGAAWLLCPECQLVVQAVQRLIGEAISGGWVRARFVKGLHGLFAARGLDPLSNGLAELIYANTTRATGALMRYRQLVQNPAAKRLTPYLTWWSLDDGHVRPEHGAMHGYTAAIDHPIWETWWPPAGHNCRCYIGTVNLAKAKRQGLTGPEPTGPWPTLKGERVMPGAGFNGLTDPTAALLESFRAGPL